MLTPTSFASQVFIGDKVGHIGVWDATEAGKKIKPPTNGAIRDGAQDDDLTAQDDVGQTELGKHWHWRVHQEDKAVSCLRYKPGEARNVSDRSLESCAPLGGAGHVTWPRMLTHPSPAPPAQLYSSSHDCTMRVTDLETGNSEEILDADYFKEDCYYHSFDFSLDGNQLWGELRVLAPLVNGGPG